MARTHLLPWFFYLSEDYAVCQLGYEGYRIVFWGEKKGLPAHPIELQLVMTRKGQELLEAFRHDSSFLAQFSTPERPGSKKSPGATVAADVSLETLLQNPSDDLIRSEQVDELWERGLANGTCEDSAGGSHTLTCHQARQLGIVPPCEKEASLKD